MSHFLHNVSVYLIGMMGSGKSTIGQRLAHQLGYQFFDTDAVVEQVTGKSVRHLFTALGEPEFRNLESRVLSELCAYKKLVVATGGGIVLRHENWGYLRHGMIVWLDVPVAQLYQRLHADDTRPLLPVAERLAHLHNLWEQRRSLYAQADVQVTYQPDETPNETATRALTQMQQTLQPNLNDGWLN